jgi:hypothetical protein
MSDDKKGGGAAIVGEVVEGAAGDAIKKAVEGGTPEEIAAAGLLGAIRAGGKHGASALATFLSMSPSDRRLAEAVAAEAHEHLGLVEPIVAENAEELLDDPEVSREDVASNTAAILDGWAKAYRSTGDSKKRRVIMAALGNAFHPETYKAGLTLRLFDILEQVDYPEIRFLRDRFNEQGSAHGGMGTAANLARPGSEGREMLERLRAHRLVDWYVASSRSREPTPRDIGGTLRRTWLGDRLLELCADTEALNERWPNPGDDVGPGCDG